MKLWMVNCYFIYFSCKIENENKLKSNHFFKKISTPWKRKSSLYFKFNFYILKWKSNNRSVFVFWYLFLKWKWNDQKIHCPSWFCFGEEGPNCETVLLILLLLFHTLDLLTFLYWCVKEVNFLHSFYV